MDYSEAVDGNRCFINSGDNRALILKQKEGERIYNQASYKQLVKEESIEQSPSQESLKMPKTFRLAVTKALDKKASWIT